MGSKQFLSMVQKRVQELQVKLSIRSNDYLDKFLQGVEAIEPPPYHVVDDNVEPPLAEVQLKEGADRFDLGNVKSVIDAKIIRVHVVVKKGKGTYERSECLPLNKKDPITYPILGNVAKELAIAWFKQYEAIVNRRDSINELRNYAYISANSKPRIAVTRRSEDNASIFGDEPQALPTPGLDRQSSKPQKGPTDDILASMATYARKRSSDGPHSPLKKIRTSDDSESPNAKSLENENTQIARYRKAFHDMVAIWQQVDDKPDPDPAIAGLKEAARDFLTIYRAAGSPFECLHKAAVKLSRALKQAEGGAEQKPQADGDRPASPIVSIPQIASIPNGNSQQTNVCGETVHTTTTMNTASAAQKRVSEKGLVARSIPEKPFADQSNDLISVPKKNITHQQKHATRNANQQVDNPKPCQSNEASDAKNGFREVEAQTSAGKHTITTNLNGNNTSNTQKAAGKPQVYIIDVSSSKQSASDRMEEPDGDIHNDAAKETLANSGYTLRSREKGACADNAAASRSILPEQQIVRSAQTSTVLVEADHIIDLSCKEPRNGLTSKHAELYGNNLSKAQSGLFEGGNAKPEASLLNTYQSESTNVSPVRSLTIEATFSTQEPVSKNSSQKARNDHGYNSAPSAGSSQSALFVSEQNPASESRVIPKEDIEQLKVSGALNREAEHQITPSAHKKGLTSMASKIGPLSSEDATPDHPLVGGIAAPNGNGPIGINVNDLQGCVVRPAGERLFDRSNKPRLTPMNFQGDTTQEKVAKWRAYCDIYD